MKGKLSFPYMVNKIRLNYLKQKGSYVLILVTISPYQEAYTKYNYCEHYKCTFGHKTIFLCKKT